MANTRPSFRRQTYQARRTKSFPTQPSLSLVADSSPKYIPFQQETFKHHGLTFYIEAEGCSSEESGRTAIAELRKWVLQLHPEQTTALFISIMHERKAILDEIEFDHHQYPLPDLRAAQRNAAFAAMPQNETTEQTGKHPLIILEAGVL